MRSGDRSDSLRPGFEPTLTERVKVHLIDGTFELFRCFHGAPRVDDASGREVGAAIGMLATLTSLLRQADVSHVAVAFDQMASPARRPDATEPGKLIRSQYPLVLDLVRAIGIAVWPMWRFQADDALATGAVRFKHDPAVAQVVICTTDKDLAQCVDGQRVVLLDRIRKRVSDEGDVRARFGIAPASIPDYFGLVGDPSDGLPGVPGWGPKSASTILSHYQRIENIPADAADWAVSVRGARRLSDTLQVRRNEALLYRNLSYRRTDVPLVDTLDDLKWRGPDWPVLRALCTPFDAEPILDRLQALVSAR